jgi:hypothetical protein
VHASDAHEERWPRNTPASSCCALVFITQKRRFQGLEERCGRRVVSAPADQAPGGNAGDQGELGEAS